MGPTFITYHNATTVPVKTDIPKLRECFSCYVKIDSCRFVLGDDRGQLYMLHLSYDAVDRIVKGIHIECLGDSCIPSFLGYLKEALYVGSKVNLIVLFDLINQSIST